MTAALMGTFTFLSYSGVDLISSMLFLEVRGSSNLVGHMAMLTVGVLRTLAGEKPASLLNPNISERYQIMKINSTSLSAACFCVFLAAQQRRADLRGPNQTGDFTQTRRQPAEVAETSPQLNHSKSRQQPCADKTRSWEDSSVISVTSSGPER